MFCLFCLHIIGAYPHRRRFWKKTWQKTYIIVYQIILLCTINYIPDTVSRVKTSSWSFIIVIIIVTIIVIINVRSLSRCQIFIYMRTGRELGGRNYEMKIGLRHAMILHIRLRIIRNQFFGNARQELDACLIKTQRRKREEASVLILDLVFWNAGAKEN